QLALTDLFITHDPATHRLRLLSKRLKKEILPVHLGLMADFWLPPLCRFLLRIFSSGPANPSPFAMRLLVGTRPSFSYYPRLVLGQIIVERATWMIPAAFLPRREKGTSAFDYMLSIQRWLAGLDLPQECFVRVLSQRSTSRETWTRQVPSPATMNKNRKPLYIDFGNYLSIMMFEQVVDQTTWALLLQEVLPAHNDLVITDGQASYASEYIFELTRRTEDV